MKLSIVSTLYNSQDTLLDFYGQISLNAEKIVGEDYEIVLVVDGSQDNSLKIALNLAENDSHIYVIELSRNFGHHQAMLTGLSYTKGGLVFLIDADLEENPKLLVNFFEEMVNSDYDVIYGVQRNRKGGIQERYLGMLFYRIFNSLTSVKIPESMVVARLMTRQYVDSLLSFTEKEVFIGGLWALTGFKQKALYVDKTSRGNTSYTFAKKLKQAISAVTSFSSAPLYAIFVSGMLIFTLSILFVLLLIVNWYLYSSAPSGYTSLIASVWIIGGLVIMFLGVIGIYLAKIFSEVKNRPRSIVKSTYRK